MEFLFFVGLSKSEKGYSENESIPVLFSNIYPKKYPAESVPLSSFSFFREINKTRSPLTAFVDSIVGDDLFYYGIRIPFKGKSQKIKGFGKNLTSEDINSFNKYIKGNYCYKLTIDGIDFLAPIGENNEGRIKVFTRFEFTLKINKNKIIDVDISMINPKELHEGKELSFYYFYNFETTAVSYSNRMIKYLDAAFFSSSTHDYSSSLSIIQAILFSMIVFAISKQMITDFDISNESKGKVLDDFDEQDANKGWKALHGDVFRPPSNACVLSVLSGLGCNAAAALFIASFVAFVFNDYGERKYLFSLFIKAFLFSGIFSGMTSTAFGKSMNQKKWEKLAIYSVLGFFSFLFFAEMLFSIFLHGKTSYALSFSNIIIYYVICCSVCISLSILGGFLSNYLKIYESNPNVVALIPKKIPVLPFYLRPFAVCCVGCFIIGSCVLPEFNYVITAIWKGKLYYTYYYLFCSIVSTLLCSGLLSVCVTFFRLQKECYKWHWLSFAAPSSCFFSLVIYSVCLYFKGFSEMNVTGTIVFFFSTTIISAIISFACGGIGFFASNLFVRIIYSNLKLE